MLISKLRPWTEFMNNPSVALTRSLMDAICSHSSEIPSTSLKVDMMAGHRRPPTDMGYEQKHCRHERQICGANWLQQYDSSKLQALLSSFYCAKKLIHWISSKVWDHSIMLVLTYYIFDGCHLESKPLPNISSKVIHWGITTSSTPIVKCVRYKCIKIVPCYPHGMFPTILMQSSWPSSQLDFPRPGPCHWTWRRGGRAKSVCCRLAAFGEDWWWPKG